MHDAIDWRPCHSPDECHSVVESLAAVECSIAAAADDDEYKYHH